MPKKNTRLDSKREVTEKEIGQALERPSDFGYFGEDKDLMFVTWSLGPVIETRDSDVLTRANAEALKRHLRSDPTLEKDWRIVGCSHWAVGHVDHLSFRALTKPLDKGGKPTRIFRIVMEWFDGLRECLVADESLYSEMELEEWNRAVDAEVTHLQHRGRIRENLTDDEQSKLCQALGERDNDPDSVTQENVLEAAKELGLLTEDDEEVTP